ncbi:heavy metal translocating P-type ATPase [Flaviflagellibacter deserti]|uniref:P-type Zn(2+) transporter n=1 Tax=Flaviflagellibacter deserti TaxID=2267266 RepID=A0ABV9YUM9_9HYPH
MAALSPLKLRVEGMDCGACALKIENAMKRLPGVSDINVSYGQESVALTFDEDRTSALTIKEKIRALGFTPISERKDLVAPRSAPVLSAREPWWRGKKGRLVIFAAAMFGAAFAAAQIEPQWSQWAYSAAAVISIVPFARRAFAGAISGTPFSIETLMSIAAFGAVLIGAAEEAAVVILLFAVGELLETIAAGRARAGIEALIDLVPRVAFRERDGVVERISVDDLALGDIVIVRPGDRVPSDGKILEGFSELDEAPVTGESVPIAKQAGDKVFAGSINTNGELRVEISHVAADNTIARIIHLVEEAQGSKAPMARLIDRFSAWYTPAAMAAAALVIVVPPLVFDADWMTWVYRGLATLLISCPCALVISTPAAIASGLAAGARKGLLIRGGAALEMLGKVRTVAFDKTGTLTLGRPQVTDIVPIVGNEGDVLARAAAVERNTSHPLGIAIVEAATARALDIPASFGGAIAVPGKAVTTRLKDGFASVGSPRYAAEQTAPDESVSRKIVALEEEGKTVVVLLSGKRVEGLLALRDEPREDAAVGIARLNAAGISTVMLTGDNRRTADATAGKLGLVARAELLPEAKLLEIADMKKLGPIAMIGDGINDAPALAAASVGVAMGGGADVALETADAALLRNRVTGVADLIELSQATLGNIWQNIGLALGLKAVFLGTTLFGVTTLWMAILADTGATVLVTANALRLLRLGLSVRHSTERNQ